MAIRMRLLCRCVISITCALLLISLVTYSLCSDYDDKLHVHFSSSLIPCPCTTNQADRDPDFVDSNFFSLTSFLHRGAARCYRSSMPTREGSGQQCCYDTGGNILVDPPAGGTADRYSPMGYFLKHFTYDVIPGIVYCQWLDECGTYFKYRPPDDCSRYIEWK